MTPELRVTRCQCAQVGGLARQGGHVHTGGGRDEGQMGKQVQRLEPPATPIEAAELKAPRASSGRGRWPRHSRRRAAAAAPVASTGKGSTNRSPVGSHLALPRSTTASHRQCHRHRGGWATWSLLSGGPSIELASYLPPPQGEVLQVQLRWSRALRSTRCLRHEPHASNGSNGGSGVGYRGLVEWIANRNRGPGRRGTLSQA